MALVNQYYGNTKDDDAKIDSGSLYSYVEYSKNQYFLMGRFRTAQDKYLRCRKDEKSTSDNNHCEIYFLLHVDMNKGLVKRLDTHDLYEISDNGLIVTGPLQGYDVYGCYLRTALRTSDINLDGQKDIFMFGGVGEFGSDEGGQVIKTTLTIYDGSTTQKQFVEELSYENFIIDDMGENNTKFQSVGWLQMNDNGSLKYVGVRQGVRRFSKLYFKDYDNNGLLDIIIWRKEYGARLKTDNIKGYELQNTEYLRYEESDNGFVRKSTPPVDIELWLNDSKYIWQDGYPKKSECGYGVKLIDDYSEPQLKIIE
ncbi:MAG: hypothetical protein GY951_10185 [Psychromonas sp.]|nr:hypothetical protein [Psychromonas sp.]